MKEEIKSFTVSLYDYDIEVEVTFEKSTEVDGRETITILGYSDIALISNQSEINLREFHDNDFPEDLEEVVREKIKDYYADFKQ